MAAAYRLSFTTDKGLRLADVEGRLFQEMVYGLSISKIANEPGEMILRVPYSFDRSLLQRDHMIRIWRTLSNGATSLFQVFFITGWSPSVEDGRRVLEVFGAGPNAILEWRHVAYYAEEAQSKKESMAADTMMEEIVDENFVAVEPFATGEDDADREWGSHFSVETAIGGGPSLTKGFAWREVLRTLQEISEESRERSPAVWFDVVPHLVSSTNIEFQFRTYLNQPGRDLTSLGVLVSPSRGNLIDPKLEYDYRNEKTTMYGLGSGQESDRVVQVVSDDARVDIGYWGRKEGTVRHYAEEEAAVTGKAYTALRERGARIRFTGNLADTEHFIYGQHWRWGDRVRVQYEKEEFDAIIRVVRITVREGEEKILARLEYES